MSVTSCSSRQGVIAAPRKGSQPRSRLVASANLLTSDRNPATLRADAITQVAGGEAYAMGDLGDSSVAARWLPHRWKLWSLPRPAIAYVLGVELVAFGALL